MRRIFVDAYSVGKRTYFRPTKCPNEINLEYYPTCPRQFEKKKIIIFLKCRAGAGVGNQERNDQLKFLEVALLHYV